MLSYAPRGKKRKKSTFSLTTFEINQTDAAVNLRMKRDYRKELGMTMVHVRELESEKVKKPKVWKANRSRKFKV